MRIKFSIQQDYWYFYIVGWGKTGPAHSFPLLNLSIFYWSFCLSVYVTLSLYFNIYERPIPKWESSFQSNKIIGTSTLLGGERLGQPILSPLQNFWSFYWSVSLSVYVTLSLYLNTSEWPIPKRESSFQTKHFICTATLWGGERLGWPILSPPPPKCSDLSIYLSVFQFMLFFYCIWRLMNDSFQRDNQIFKPKSLLVISLQSVPTFVFYLSELIFPNSGMGKDWVDFPLTHSNNHFELRTYSFFFWIG